MEALSFDNILGEQEIDSLFGGSEEDVTPAEEKKVPEESGADKKEKKENETTEVVSQDDLFGDEDLTQPESVGSGKKQEGKEKEDAVPEGGDTSPQNFYSSIAKACAVDGIFPNLDEEMVSKAGDAESFRALIEAEVNARLDEKQQRISKALENGVETSDIRQYETILNNLSKITDTTLAAENEQGEKLRRDLIYQDYLNKGVSPERAQKLTERSIDAGTDVEDAKDALQGNREYFQGRYDKLLQDAQDAADKQQAELQKQEAQLKKAILEDKQLMGDMELDSDVRRRVYETISRPIYKDAETGEYLTALQKYEREHHSDFIKYVGLFMTLTNGFKDFKSFTKGEVRKEMKKGLRELEQTLSNTRRNSDGSLNLVGGRKSDPESFLDGNFRLAL